MATAGVTLWSTTAASNATADPAVNWAEGQAPSSVNDSARSLMQSVANWRNDLYGITTGGTSAAYTISTGASFATAAAMSGAIFTIIPNATNTSATTTLAVDGLTARQINISTGVGAPIGALVLGTPYPVKYVHASTEFILLGNVGKNLLTAVDIINGTSLTTIATDDTLPIYDLSATANKRILVSDVLKVINLLTTDSSPDSAADYVMTYDNSASAAKKVLLANMPSNLPRGYIDGCVIANGTDTTNDINIAAGKCRDSTDAVDIVVSALSGKQLDANWAAGAAAGMRNSAAGIADTTYHIYAVRTAASSTADIYAHTSLTVATVLTALQAESGGASYVYARRIASIVRSGATIIQFKQYGDDFWWTTAINDITTTTLGTSRTNFALTVPTGLIVLAKIAGHFFGGSLGDNVWFSNPNLTDSAPSPTTGFDFGIVHTNGDGTNFAMPTDTSAQISARASAASFTLKMVTRGYTDTRGKDS